MEKDIEKFQKEIISGSKTKKTESDKNSALQEKLDKSFE